MQAPALAERKGARVAANFQNDGAEARHGKGGFSNPQRILHRARQAEDKAADIKPIGLETKPIGQPRLVGRHRLADPENGGRRLAFFKARLLAKYAERCGKTGCGTRIPRLGIADFRQTFKR